MARDAQARRVHEIRGIEDAKSGDMRLLCKGVQHLQSAIFSTGPVLQLGAMAIREQQSFLFPFTCNCH